MNDATPVSLADDQQSVLVERIRHSAEQLRGCIDVDPQRRGGVPVLKGTRFPVSQVLAQIAEGDSLADLVADLELEEARLRELFHGLANLFDQPLPQ
jgi:uncharacterized protein (DUF433 family)